MIGFAIASIGGTSYLWYTYFDIKRSLDKTEQTEKYSLLVESVRNETAFFWYSIVATVLTVSELLLLLSHKLRKTVCFLGDNFDNCYFYEETSRLSGKSIQGNVQMHNAFTRTVFPAVAHVYMFGYLLYVLDVCRGELNNNALFGAFFKCLVVLVVSCHCKLSWHQCYIRCKS